MLQVCGWLGVLAVISSVESESPIFAFIIMQLTRCVDSNQTNFEMQTGQKNEHFPSSF